MEEDMFVKRLPVLILLLVTRLSEGVGEPLETLVQTISGRSAGGLDILW